MRKFRKKLLRNSKGERFYQIHGPDPKTGKERYFETVKGPGNVSKRADARIVELTTAAFNMTEFGKRETRTFGDLLDKFMQSIEQRHARTVTDKAWHGSQSIAGETRRNYFDAIRRFLKPKLGEIVLVALDLDDCQRCVDEVEAKVSKPQARKCGELIRTVIRSQATAHCCANRLR